MLRIHSLLQLHESHELIWDDGVAPEVTIDFDAQNIDTETGLKMWLGGIGFFVSLFQFIKWTDPESKNPAVNREFDMIKETIEDTNPREMP